MVAIVEIENVAFHWPSQKPILGIDHFKLDRGEHVYLRGPSGSGKSTLLSLIAGVITPQQGGLFLQKHPLHKLAAAQRDRIRADHIGFIFQMFNLLPFLTPIENVSLPCEFSSYRRKRMTQSTIRAEAARLLEALGINAALHTRKSHELSIGQQQRVAAARALIGRPELVIADEPTSALDEENRELFLNTLFNECEATNATLLLVSHDRSLQSLFHRVVELNQVNQVVSQMAIANTRRAR